MTERSAQAACPGALARKIPRLVRFTDPQTDVARAAKARAAMCVRSVDDQGVLQFTLILAAGCVLHRRTSRVIHRQELFLGSFSLVDFNSRRRRNRPFLTVHTPRVIKKLRGAPAIAGPRCKPSSGIPACAGVVRPPSLDSGTRHRGRGYGGRFALWLSPGSRIKCTCCWFTRPAGCKRLGPRSATEGNLARGVFSLVKVLAYSKQFGNDPSAGSPTETLLRLLLPLNDQV